LKKLVEHMEISDERCKIDYEFLQKENVIVFTIFGVFDPGESKDMLYQMTNMMSKFSCHRCLVDLRDAEWVVELGEVIERSKIVYEYPNADLFKSVIIVNQINEKYEFVANAYTMRGSETKVYTDYNEALAWLIKK